MNASTGIKGGHLWAYRTPGRLESKKHPSQHRVGIGLYIPDDKDLFDRLHDKKEEIEAELGYQLDWRRLDDKKASRIIFFENKPETEDAEIDWFIKSAEEFGAAFKKATQF